MAPRTKKETKAVKPAEENLPALSAFDGMGDGFEGADSESYAIPFLNILQSNSPAVEDEIEGCTVGRLFNTVTELAVDTCCFIPITYKRRIVEWIKRIDGGGFVAEYAPGDPNMPHGEFNEDTGKTETEDGHDLVDTRYHYGIIVYDDGTYEPALITMSSTQLRKSKRWMALMKSVCVNGKSRPTFSQMYRLSSTKEENDKGKWRGWVINHEGPVDEENESLVNTIIGFRKDLMEGRVTEDMDQFRSAGGGDDDVIDAEM